MTSWLAARLNGNDESTRRRVPLAVLLLAVVLAQLGWLSCHCEARRLHGSVACLDCAAGHDLSGVIVAVKCAAGNDSAAAVHAAQTDARGTFEVAVPASVSPCATRVLGATQGLTVARVVPERAPGSSSSYALGSRLAFFTRCGPGAATTMAADHDQGRRASPRVPRPTPRTPVRSLPHPPAGGSGGGPYGMGGLPIIYFFPFVPIIGIP